MLASRGRARHPLPDRRGEHPVRRRQGRDRASSWTTDDVCLGGALVGGRFDKLVRGDRRAARRRSSAAARTRSTSRGGKGYEAGASGREFVRVVPPPIELVNWDEIEGKRSRSNGEADERHAVAASIRLRSCRAKCIAVTTHACHVGRIVSRQSGRSAPDRRIWQPNWYDLTHGIQSRELQSTMSAAPHERIRHVHAPHETSRSSKAWSRSASGRPCTSAASTPRGCTTSSGRSSITPSTSTSTATPTPSPSRCTSPATPITVTDNGRGIPVGHAPQAQEVRPRAGPDHAARRRQVRRQATATSTPAACTASARRSSTPCRRSSSPPSAATASSGSRRSPAASPPAQAGEGRPVPRPRHDHLLRAGRRRSSRRRSSTPT